MAQKEDGGPCTNGMTVNKGDQIHSDKNSCDKDRAPDNEAWQT